MNTIYFFATPWTLLGIQRCRGYANNDSSGSFAYIFPFGSQCLTSLEKYSMSESETTAPPASENSLHRFILNMKSDFMQHVQDFVSNAMQNFVRDEVPSESSDDLRDDLSSPLVSDEIDHFLAHNVGQHSGETLGEVS